MRTIIIFVMNLLQPLTEQSHFALYAAAWFVFAAALLPGIARADDVAISLRIRDHRFYPEELEIPAGEKCLLTIANEDATPEEFESHSLHREKIIPPNSKTNVYIGPLKPGRYAFIGEFNDQTAHGVVIAK